MCVRCGTSSIAWCTSRDRHDDEERETWTIKYTTATATWVQGRYADKGMADLNASLAVSAGMGAEVLPWSSAIRVTFTAKPATGEDA